MSEARKYSAKEWSKRLKEPSTNADSICFILQDIFQEIDKRLAQSWSGTNGSVVWLEYFTAAFRKLLREIPAAPHDISIQDLSTLVERMNLPAQPTATPNGKDEVSKPGNTATAGPFTNTTFKVDTQGDYKTRVMEDGGITSLEFLLNGPATVVVQTTATGTATAGPAAQLGILSLWKK